MILKPMKRSFYERIYNEDIIYHYTQAAKAIDYILHNKQLRFSKAVNSSDPIENRKARRSILYNTYNSHENHSEEHYNVANELGNTLNNLHQNFNQICFCKNTPSNELTENYDLYATDDNEELFGFTKLRMWDQYADRFTGVCIAFSKKKIINLNNEKFNLITGDIQYLPFNELSYKKVSDIQVNDLLKVGKEKYKGQIESYFKNSLFYKHIDYSGENEFRIGTLFDKNKCEAEVIRGEMVLGENMMLDITGCIEAIFVSSFANEKQKNELLKYANELNVELVEMKWEHNSFEAKNYKEEKMFWENLSSTTESKTL